jgi:hypothetical protein
MRACKLLQKVRWQMLFEEREHRVIDLMAAPQL